jgi:hypothetical protein
MKDNINSQSQLEAARAESVTCQPCIVSNFVPIPMAEDMARKQQTIDALQAYKEGAGILAVMSASGQRA